MANDANRAALRIPVMAKIPIAEMHKAITENRLITFTSFSSDLYKSSIASLIKLYSKGKSGANFEVLVLYNQMIVEYCWMKF